MIVYHYISSNWGLDNIAKKRLKACRFGDANDPCELLGFCSRDPIDSTRISNIKEEMNGELALFCFSKFWNSPVMWSHYADKQKGLCLGFSVPVCHLTQVKYSRKRHPFPSEDYDLASPQARRMTIQQIATKYSGWRYEQEWRRFAYIKDLNLDGNSYFDTYSDDLRLIKVFIGPNSEIKRSEVFSSLGDLAKSVQVIKTGQSPISYRIVRLRSPK